MIKLAITIDTECDKGSNWKIQQPLMFENIYSGIARYLQPLFTKYQVKPSYLLSPEVIADERSKHYFASLGKSIELGTHLHSEFIEPDANWACEISNVYQCALDSDIEKQKLENLTQLFIEAFGYRPGSFRAGRFGLSRHTLPILENLGYRVDSSVTPDTFWMMDKQHGINFLGAPYQVYRPSAEDFRINGGDGIFEVPVTIQNTKMLGWPLWLKKRINPIKKWQRLVLNSVVQPADNLKWLRPTYSSAAEMIEIAELQQARNTDASLVMMFHSNEFTIGTSPYSLSEESLGRMKKRLEAFLDYASQQQFVTVGLSEIPNYTNN